MPPLQLETDCSTLTVDIWHNEAATTARGAIIFHPWAKLGGCMEDPTVIHLFQTAIKSGLFSTVVRYDMRGAGSSRAKWNKKSLLGAPDVDDMIAVCEHVTTQCRVTQLWVLGYSYGACVAANSLEHVPQVVGYVAIGFPLGGIANLALRSRHHWNLLQDSPVPKLIVHGTRDQHGALSILRTYAVEYHEHEPAPGPLDLQVVDGADHFFDGLWQVVADKVMDWISQQVDKQHHSGTA